MSKYCPIVGHTVVYLDCLECEERVCEKRNISAVTIPPKNEKPVEVNLKPNKEQHEDISNSVNSQNDIESKCHPA